MILQGIVFSLLIEIFVCTTFRESLSREKLTTELNIVVELYVSQDGTCESDCSSLQSACGYYCPFTEGQISTETTIFLLQGFYNVSNFERTLTINEPGARVTFQSYSEYEEVVWLHCIDGKNSRSFTSIFQTTYNDIEISFVNILFNGCLNMSLNPSKPFSGLDFKRKTNSEKEGGIGFTFSNSTLQSMEMFDNHRLYESDFNGEKRTSVNYVDLHFSTISNTFLSFDYNQWNSSKTVMSSHETNYLKSFSVLYVDHIADEEDKKSGCGVDLVTTYYDLEILFLGGVMNNSQFVLQNPSQSPTQFGMKTKVRFDSVHFDLFPNYCPACVHGQPYGPLNVRGGVMNFLNFEEIYLQIENCSFDGISYNINSYYSDVIYVYWVRNFTLYISNTTVLAGSCGMMDDKDKRNEDFILCDKDLKIGWKDGKNFLTFNIGQYNIFLEDCYFDGNEKHLPVASLFSLRGEWGTEDISNKLSISRTHVTDFLFMEDGFHISGDNYFTGKQELFVFDSIFENNLGINDFESSQHRQALFSITDNKGYSDLLDIIFMNNIVDRNEIRVFFIGNYILGEVAIYLCGSVFNNTFLRGNMNNGAVFFIESKTAFLHSTHLPSFIKKGSCTRPIFENNHAYMGGAIFIDSFEQTSLIHIYGGIFRYNVASRDGGAIYVGVGSVILSNTFMEGNEAKSGNGGAFYYYCIKEPLSSSLKGVLVFHKNYFMKNIASGFGGAVYIGHEHDFKTFNRRVKDLEYSNSTFEDNYSLGIVVGISGTKRGGGQIYLDFPFGMSEEVVQKMRENFHFVGDQEIVRISGPPLIIVKISGVENKCTSKFGSNSTWSCDLAGVGFNDSFGNKVISSSSSFEVQLYFKNSGELIRNGSLNGNQKFSPLPYIPITTKHNYHSFTKTRIQAIIVISDSGTLLDMQEIELYLMSNFYVYIIVPIVVFTASFLLILVYISFCLLLFCVVFCDVSWTSCCLFVIYKKSQEELIERNRKIEKHFQKFDIGSLTLGVMETDESTPLIRKAEQDLSLITTPNRRSFKSFEEISITDDERLDENLHHSSSCSGMSDIISDESCNSSVEIGKSTVEDEVDVSCYLSKKVSKYHKFKGYLNGEGKVVFVLKGKEIETVWEGLMKDGKMNGKGKSYNVYLTDKDTSYTRYLEFRGNYKDNHRFGMGIHYDQFQQTRFNGVWNEITMDQEKVEENQEIVLIRNSIVNVIDTHVPIINQSQIKKFGKKLGEGCYFNCYQVKYDGNRYCGRFLKENTFDKLSERIEFCKDLEKSLKVLRLLRHHSNIAQPIGWTGRHHGVHEVIIVRDYCKAGTMFEVITEILRKIQSEKNFNAFNKTLFDKKLKILEGVILGMVFVSDHGVIHRDLNWSNVLLHATGRVKITDFDFCIGHTKMGRTSENNMEELSVMTEEDMKNLDYRLGYTGTRYHRAPELIHIESKVVSDHHHHNGDDDDDDDDDDVPNIFLGLKSDVFSFGIMLYELMYNTTDPYGVEAADVSKRKGKRRVIHCNNCVLKNPFLTKKNVSYHIKKCNLRPEIRPVIIEGEVKSWINEMIKECWDKDYQKRPSFKEINHRFQQVVNT